MAIKLKLGHCSIYFI